MGGRFEPGIALTTAAATGDDHLLAGRHQIKEDLLGFRIADDGARGQFKDQILAVAAGFLTALTGGAIGRLVVSSILEMVESAFVRVGDKDDVAAVTAVTAVRSAAGNEAFASKTNATASPVAGLDCDRGFVYKLHAS